MYRRNALGSFFRLSRSPPTSKAPPEASAVNAPPVGLSLLKQYGGQGFGVFSPSRKDSPKKAWEQLAAPKRVDTLNSPKYRQADDLGSLLRVAVDVICSKLDVRTKQAVR